MSDEKPLTAEEALSLIRKAGEEGNIQMAQTDLIELYEAESYEIATVLLGKEPGFISDETHVSDLGSERIEAAQQELGLSFSAAERICDIAVRLRAKRSGQAPQA